MQSELGALHAWYLLYRFSQTPDAACLSEAKQSNNPSAMQPPADISPCAAVSEWLKKPIRAFQSGFRKGFQRGFEAELQRRGIKLEIHYDGNDEDKATETNYEDIAKTIKDLSREIADTMQVIKEDLAKVRQELQKL